MKPYSSPGLGNNPALSQELGTLRHTAGNLDPHRGHGHAGLPGNDKILEPVNETERDNLSASVGKQSNGFSDDGELVLGANGFDNICIILQNAQRRQFIYGRVGNKFPPAEQTEAGIDRDGEEKSFDRNELSFSPGNERPTTIGAAARP